MAIFIGAQFRLYLNLRHLRLKAEANELRSLLASGSRPSGDWAGAITYLDTYNDRLKRSISDVNDFVSRMYVDDVRAALEGQTISWVPLSSYTTTFKAERSLDPRTLIATGKSLASLKTSPSSGYMSIFAGMSADTDEDKYFLWHEFGKGSGRGSIPARPLFGPVFNDNYSKYCSFYAKAVQVVTETSGIYRP